MKLTKHEQETIINLNEAEGIAYIYTRMKTWWRRLEKNGFKPVKVSEDAEGVWAKEFEVPKAAILFPSMGPKQRSSAQIAHSLANLARISPRSGAETTEVAPG